MSRVSGKVIEAIFQLNPGDDIKVDLCEGWATSKNRVCIFPIGKARKAKRQHVIDNLNALSFSDAVVSEYLDELVEGCLCVTHGKDRNKVQFKDLRKRFQKSLKNAAAAEAREKREQESRLRAPARGSRQPMPASVGNTERAQGRRASRQVTPETDSEADDKVDNEAPGPAPARSQRVRGASARPPLSPPVTPQRAQTARPASLVSRSRSTTPGEPPIAYARAARACPEVPKEVIEESESETTDEDSDAADFAPSWTKYETKWKSLEKYGRRRGQNLESIMPWPVLSGEYYEVTAENVSQFYQYLQRECVDDDEYMFCMNVELDRWSEDNLSNLLTRSIFRGVYRRSLKTVLKVVQDTFSDLLYPSDS